MRVRRALGRLLLTCLCVLVLDVLTKAWAQHALAQPVPVAGQFVRLTLAYNTGVAFGMLAQHGPWLIIITAPIIAGLTCWFLWALRMDALPSAAACPCTGPSCTGTASSALLLAARLHSSLTSSPHYASPRFLSVTRKSFLGSSPSSNSVMSTSS